MKKLLFLFVFCALINESFLSAMERKLKDQEIDYKCELRRIHKNCALNAAARTYAQQPHITTDDAYEFLDKNSSYRESFDRDPCSPVRDIRTQSIFGTFGRLSLSWSTIIENHHTCVQSRKAFHEEQLRDNQAALTAYTMVKNKNKIES